MDTIDDQPTEGFEPAPRGQAQVSHSRLSLPNTWRGRHMDQLDGNWRGVTDVSSENFTCGHCGWNVAPANGWDTDASISVDAISRRSGKLRICHRCNKPTYLQAQPSLQVPGVSPGQDVDKLPDDVDALYLEAAAAPERLPTPPPYSLAGSSL